MARKPLRKRDRQNYRRKSIRKEERTLDWALSNLFLTERREGILELLADRRMMTVEQLLFLHEGYGHQARSRALLQRDINVLHEVYLVDKIYKNVRLWDGSVKKSEIVAVGELGSEYLHWKFHNDRIKEYPNGRVLPITAYHTLRIHDMEIETRKIAEEMGWEVKCWVPECGWKILAHPNRLNPDAFCLLYDPQKKVHFSLFLEYDTGKDDIGRTTKFPKLTAKFNKYREIKQWSGWYEKAFSQEVENKFPHLFFVTEEPKRFPRIPELLAERNLDHTVCMQEDYRAKLKEYLQQKREGG